MLGARRRLNWVIAALMLGSLTAAWAVAGGTAGAARSRSVAALANCSRTSVGFTPLIDLGNRSYHGSQGGLYPNGANTPPSNYLALGRSAATLVTPRASDGRASASGKIVLLSIGMSNARDEFAPFENAANTSTIKNPRLVIVNGAEPNQTADIIDSSSAPYWNTVDTVLASAGVTTDQVQAVWLKEAIANPRGAFPNDALALKTDLDLITGILGQRFPQLRLVYLSSRTYGGYATTPLNPEPFAYESGFAVKWLIQDRINQKTTSGPWLGWGPYLWTDGLAGRSDGLVWTCNDVETDGTHPSASGRQKVANLLLSFFESDPTATPWFLARRSTSLSAEANVVASRAR